MGENAIAVFSQALEQMSTVGDAFDRYELEAKIMLNLANAFSAKGNVKRAMELYNKIITTKALKKTKIFFLTRYNMCLLLIKMGQVEEATTVLSKMAASKLPVVDDVKGSIYLALGNLSLAEGDVSKARGYFERSLMATADEDWRAQAQARKCTAQAYLVAGEVEEAIETLDEVLAVLSASGEDGKSIKLL